MDKVQCPFCATNTPVWKEPAAECRGLWVKCKKCGKEFEIVIKKPK